MEKFIQNFKYEQFFTNLKRPPHPSPFTINVLVPYNLLMCLISNSERGMQYHYPIVLFPLAMPSAKSAWPNNTGQSHDRPCYYFWPQAAAWSPLSRVGFEVGSCIPKPDTHESELAKVDLSEKWK